MITIEGVLAADADAWWPRVEPWCEQALAYGGGLMSMDDVKRFVRERDMQLWTIHDGQELKAVCVTEITQWPQAKTITAILVGGTDMRTWVRVLADTLTRYGRAQGCTVLDCRGRVGWKKALEALGCRQAAVTFMKEI